MSINQYRETVVDFGVDTRGWTWFQHLANYAQRGLSGGTGRRYGIAKGTAEVTFNGLTKQPIQQFRGLAPLGQGTARPIYGATELSDTLSDNPLNSSSLRIFAQRLRRGR